MSEPMENTDQLYPGQLPGAILALTYLRSAQATYKEHVTRAEDGRNAAFDVLIKEFESAIGDPEGILQVAATRVAYTEECVDDLTGLAAVPGSQQAFQSVHALRAMARAGFKDLTQMHGQLAGVMRITRK